MRRLGHAGNVDTAQKELVAKLRSAGVSVAITAAQGSGFPDLVCGFRGRNILLEVKTGKDQLNVAQVAWHAKWAGQVTVVRDFNEAMAAVLKEAQ